MKRILAISFLLITSFAFAQRQTKYESQTLIQSGKTYIHITNNFITDSDRKYIPSTLQFPFKEERLRITGARLNLSVMRLDTGEFFKGGISGWLQDTMPEHQEWFSLPNMQVRISRNKQVVIQWKDVLAFPMSFIDTSVIETKTSKPNYILLNDTLAVNDSLVLEVRSMQKPDAVFRMRFVRIPLPVVPFQAMMMHDSSLLTSEAEFIKHAVEISDEEFKSINSFYKDWPALYGQDNENHRYFSSSKLAFYFRKYNESYPDFSLEYALVTDDSKDTVWRSSGHLILVTKLQANRRYSLLVRYKNAPENVWQEHFYVAPSWYQTDLFYFVSIALTGLLIGGVTIFVFQKQKWKKEKRKREKLRLEQKAIRSQLNPHFIFNAMSSIQSLMNANKTEEANHYLTEFSSLLRDSLGNSEKEMLPLQIELQILDRYIKLEQLRFHFGYEIVVDEAINISTVDIPSLLLQPLVENAIKHGASELGKKGNVHIAFVKEKANLVITTKDNGKGFSAENENSGYGLRLTKNRIRLLNESGKEQEIALLIDSNASGTTIALHFSNWL